MLEALINKQAKQSLKKVAKSICRNIRRDRMEAKYFWSIAEKTVSMTAETEAEEFDSYVKAERSSLKIVLNVYKSL